MAERPRRLTTSRAELEEYCHKTFSGYEWQNATTRFAAFFFNGEMVIHFDSRLAAAGRDTALLCASACKGWRDAVRRPDYGFFAPSGSSTFPCTFMLPDGEPCGMPGCDAPSKRCGWHLDAVRAWYAAYQSDSAKRAWWKAKIAEIAPSSTSGCTLKAYVRVTLTEETDFDSWEELMTVVDDMFGGAGGNTASTAGGAGYAEGEDDAMSGGTGVSTPGSMDLRSGATASGKKPGVPQRARLAAVKRELETVIDEAYVARGRFAAEAAFQATVSDTLIAAGFANSREQPVANKRFDIIVTGTNQHYPAGGQYHADMGPIVLELKLMGLKLTPAAAMKDKEQVLGYVQLQDGLVERTAGSRYVAAAAVVYAPKSNADGADGLAPAVKGETVVTWVYLGAKYRGG